MPYSLQQELEQAAACLVVADGDLEAVVRRARRRTLRRHQRATMLVGIFAAALAVIAVNTSREPGSTAAVAPSSESGGPTVSPAPYDDRKPTRAGLLGYFERPLPGVERVDRVAVKKATWGQVASLMSRTYQLGSQPDTIGAATEMTYVVVQSGTLSPPADNPGAETRTYAVIVFAAEGGRPLVHLNRPDREPWPAFFDELQDEGGE